MIIKWALYLLPINEFYIIQHLYKENEINFKYFSESLEKWLQKEILDKGILKSTLNTPNVELQEFIRKVMKIFQMDLEIFFYCRCNEGLN